MSVDILRLLAVVAGFAMILSASVLAFRQTIQWQHVIVFCLGGVLAGISGVQLQVGKDVNVSIGQLAQATSQTSSAAAQQADALAALNTRVDQLQAAIQALHTASGPQPNQADIARILAPSNQARLTIGRLLLNSKSLTAQAATTSQRLSVLSHP